MALAIDPSMPAVVSGSTTAISTASTSYPAACFFLVAVGRNGPLSSQDDTGTVSGAGLTWTLAGRKSSVGATGQISGGSAQPGCFEYWWAYSASALTSVTITDTRADSASGSGNEHAMQVIPITGAETTWGGAITANAIAAGTPSCNLTTTANNAWVFAGNSDWAAKGNATVGSSQTLISQYHLAGQISIHFWRRTATTATSGTAVTMNLTAPTLEQYNMLDIEVREAGGGGGSVSGDASLSVTADRTATGVVGKVTGAALAVTASIVAAGAVATSTGASLPVTASITASGAVGTSSGASLAATATITAAGSVVSGFSGSASLAVTDTITATGLVATSTGASLAETATITAAGVVGTSTTASLPVTATITAAGSVVSGASGSASLPVTVTTTAAGSVATFGATSIPVTATITAAGTVARASGATSAITATITATGAVVGSNDGTPVRNPRLTLTLPDAAVTLTRPDAGLTLTLPDTATELD